MAYSTSQIKRVRATKADMAERRMALYEIVSEQQPIDRPSSVLSGHRERRFDTEDGCGKVQRMLVEMRRDGDLPYDWIADNTRWMRKPRTFGGPEEALRRTVETLPQGALGRRRRLCRDLA